MIDAKTRVLELLADVVFDLFVAEPVNEQIAREAFAGWNWESADLDDPTTLREAVQWYNANAKWYSSRFKPIEDLNEECVSAGFQACAPAKRVKMVQPFKGDKNERFRKVRSSR